MKAILKTESDGSPSPRLEAKGPGTAEPVSQRDLKLLSLEFIGETDGVFYFRDPAEQSRTYSGDRADYVEWRTVKAAHPLMDPATANAALSMKKMAAAVTIA